jgi:hypothetical protein
MIKIKKRFWKKTKLSTKKVWQEILGGSNQAAWLRIKETAKKGPRILIATSTGGHMAVTPVESLLAVALTLRGADVQFLLCDKFLPACSQADTAVIGDLENFVNHGLSDTKCPACYRKGNNIYQALGLPIHLYSELVPPAERQQAAEIVRAIAYESIPRFIWEGLAVGEHAMAGALRFFGRGSLDGEPFAEQVLRRYFEAALLTALALSNLLRNTHFDCAVFHHGIYVPQGLIGEVARQSKVRVVNWIPAYRKKCFVFSHEDTYHHTMISEPVDRWENLSWHPEIEHQLADYLKSRWQGSQDWISFHRNPQFGLEVITAETGIDFSRPCIGMLTNVMWDAQLHYPVNAFPNMLDWVLRTIAYFQERPELQLLIRIHPAEITGIVPSRQRIAAEIRKAFSALPQNVFIIPPESRISTYVAMQQCDAVIIYGTKTGVELTSMGIPVIVAGEAWIRGKGITQDAGSIDAYFQLLNDLPCGKRLDEATTLRARKYAYHFFFRRMIPLKVMEPVEGYPPNRLVLQDLTDIEPGRCKGLDVVCDGILNDSDFIYPAEALLNPC